MAISTKILLETFKIKPDFNVNTIQRMDFDVATHIPAYDFLSFLEQNFTPIEYIGVKNQLDKAVIFRDHTKRFFNTPINVFSGLSIYLPTKSDTYTSYYSTLAWYESSGWNILFY